MQTPFDQPCAPVPSPSGDFQGERGGHTLDGASGEGLVRSPFDQPCITTAGPKETPGGVIPNLPTIDRFTGDTPPGAQDVSTYTANRVWPASKAENS